MKLRAVLLFALAAGISGLVASALAGDNTNLPYASWSDDFESYTNGTPLVDGTNGWYGSSADIVVQTNTASSGTKAAMIPVDCTLSNRFASRTSTNVWHQLNVKVALYDGVSAPTMDTNAAVMFYINSNGNFAVCNGTNWQTLTTNVTGEAIAAVTNGAWIGVHIHQNFTQTNWTLFANRVLLTNAIGFVNTAITNFTGFDLYNGGSTSYLDNVAVLITNPPDLATNGNNWLPGLAVTPAAATNSVFVNRTVSNSYFNVFRTNGFYALTFTNAANVAWMTLSANGGVSTGDTRQVYMACSATGLSVGSYTGTVAVTGYDATFGFSASNSPQTVTMVLNVMDMQRSPGGLTNEVMLGRTPTPQTFTLANNGAGSFNYTISDNATWVTPSSNSGTLGAYETNVITLTYGSTVGWTPATSNATVTIVSTNGGGATQTVAVTMKTMDMQAAPSGLTNMVAVGYTPTAQSFTIVNPGTVPLAYTLATNVSWVTCADPAGGALTAPGTNTITVNYANTTGWTPGVSNVLITLTSTNGGGATQTVAVVMNVVSVLPPTGVTASEGTYTDKVRVAWNEVTNATGYQLWRSTMNDTNTATNLSVTTDMTYDDTTVAQDVIYYYWIKSTNNLGVSAFSASDSGYRNLPAPTGVTAGDGTYTDKVAVTWQSLSGAVAYEVWRNSISDTNTAGKISDPNPTAANYNDTTASAGTRYYYWVKARSSTDCVSAFSTPDTGWRALSASAITASDGLRGEIRVSWTPASGAVRYELLRNVVDDYTTAELLTNSAATSYRDIAMSMVTVYFYWVKAVCDLGETISGSDTGWARGRKWDFNGDNQADAWYYSQIGGCWYVVPSGSVIQAITFGGSEMAAAPEDYDGDGKADPAVFEWANRTWYALLSGSGYNLVQAQMPGSLPSTGILQLVPDDYDGDGKADPAVYEETTGTWLAMLSGSQYAQVSLTSFGGSEMAAAPEDYDGDGKTDPAVYQESSGNWFILLSGSGYQLQSYHFGTTGCTPVPAEYNGLGHAQIAVYQQTSGYWFIRLNADDYETIQFGAPGYSPIPADYDGDGYDDTALFYRDRHDALWYLLESSGGLRTISGRQSRP